MRECIYSFFLLCRDKASEDNIAYSKCEMYNVTGPLIGSGNVSDLSIIGKMNRILQKVAYLWELTDRIYKADTFDP